MIIMSVMVPILIEFWEDFGRDVSSSSRALPFSVSGLVIAQVRFILLEWSLGWLVSKM